MITVNICLGAALPDFPYIRVTEEVKKFCVCSIDKDVHSLGRRYLLKIEQGLISLSLTSACVVRYGECINDK